MMYNLIYYTIVYYTIRRKYAEALNPRIYRGYIICRYYRDAPIVVCELLLLLLLLLLLPVTTVAVYAVLYFGITRRI